MKKIALIIISFFVLSFSVFAQLSIESQQILVPQNVYIGDVAELRVTFNSNTDMQKIFENTNSVNVLSQSYFSEGLNSQEYTIKSLSITQSGVNFYTFIITFIPWKTGDIKFPPYNLGKAIDDLNSTDNNEHTNLSILIFEKITIDSILKQNSYTSLCDFEPPKVIPGTIYKIYAFLIIVVVILIILIRLLIKRKSVAQFIRNYQINRKYKKNRNSTIRKLRKIGRNNEANDKELAQEIQNIVRAYLEKKFDSPFTRYTTSEILPSFFQLTNNLMTEEKNEAMEKINSVFIRTDFIRYASSADENSCFLQNELEQIIETLVLSITAIENTKSESDSKKEKEL